MELENRSRIRDHDWIFNALWMACGDKRVPKCSMNIPVTVIFKEGVPLKAVETDRESGLVERLDLGHKRFAERDLGEVGFQDLRHRSLRALRKVLLEFSDANRFADGPDFGEPFFAKVQSSPLALQCTGIDSLYCISGVVCGRRE